MVFHQGSSFFPCVFMLYGANSWLMKIHAGVNELRKGFLQNKNLAETDSLPTNYLLLFYAVECGLKSIYLKRQSFRTTADIKGDLDHDISKWVKELRLSATIKIELSSFRLTRNAKNNRLSSSSYSLSDAHQVWRYGIEMNSDDEKKLVQWLKEIKQWIEENI